MPHECPVPQLSVSLVSISTPSSNLSYLYRVRTGEIFSWANKSSSRGISPSTRSIVVFSGTLIFAPPAITTADFATMPALIVITPFLLGFHIKSFSLALSSLLHKYPPCSFSAFIMASYRLL
jgi:hypothetical protein